MVHRHHRGNSPTPATLVSIRAAFGIVLATARSIRDAFCDRRGVTSLIFGVVVVGIIGLAGLATEGGSWYVEKRHGQNTADAAARAGALGLFLQQTNASEDPVADATYIATQNNYTQGSNSTTVAITTVSYTNPTTGLVSPGVKAVLTRSAPPLFSGLFLANKISINETAIAILPAGAGNVCALALSGGLNFSGSTSVTAGNCALASNATGASAISMGGNASSVTGTLVSSGGCSNCVNATAFLTNQTPSTNPFNTVYNPTTGIGLTMPSFSGANCLSVPTVSGTAAAPTTLTPWTSANQVAYCSSGSGPSSKLSTVAGAYLNLAPGTYFFQNVSLDFKSGNVECTNIGSVATACTPGGAGVTIILTGTAANKIGTISIGGSAVVALNAPKTNSYNSAFNGVLFYMDKIAQPSNGIGNAPVKFSGSSTIQLSGGMYFPTVNVTYTGNVASQDPNAACTLIIGQSVIFTGSSSVTVSGCAKDGTAVPQALAIALVQ